MRSANEAGEFTKSDISTKCICSAAGLVTYPLTHPLFTPALNQASAWLNRNLGILWFEPRGRVRCLTGRRCFVTYPSAAGGAAGHFRSIVEAIL
jgi:hypothetical protein